ncbi:MAG: hypothetical protein WCC06_04960 [Candidatus Aminicenantales bacterium]
MENLEKIITVKGRKFLLKVETSQRALDYVKYEELRNEIWGFLEDNLPGSRNMMCENFLHEGSSLFIGIYMEERRGGFKEDQEHLVGFAYGFVGVKDKNIAFKDLNNLWFYSQYTGIRPDFQGYNLGVWIKKFQGEILRDLFGIHTVTCTYDPLTGINAYRNVHTFGMEVLEYRVATYGEYGGYLNRLDVPTDRFFLGWDLQRECLRPAYDFPSLLDRRPRILGTEHIRIQGKTRLLELEKVKEVCLCSEEKFLLVQIPFDFYLMLRETDVPDNEIRNIPVEWRMKTRLAFLELFRRGYKVIDFKTAEGPKPESFYILTKPKASTE